MDSENSECLLEAVTEATAPEPIPLVATGWQYANWQYPPQYIVSLGSRPSYYNAPTVERLEVTGETAKQVKVAGHRNRYQHKVYCLPNDDAEATWKQIQTLQEGLDIALYQVAAKLRALGHYPDKLAEYDNWEEAENPLSSSVIHASNPDDERGYEYGLPWEENSYFLHARRQAVIRHTAQMLRYVATGEKVEGGTYEEESLTGQKGWFLCPTDADWESYEALRQKAIRASLALHQLLLPLGTYDQVRKDAAVHALRATNTSIDDVIASFPAPIEDTVKVLQSALTENESPVDRPDAPVALAPDRDSETVVSPVALLPLSAHPVWIDPNLVRLDLGTQPRASGMLDKLLKRYAKEMKTELWNWESHIPTVLFDGWHYFPNGAGHHRIGAAAVAEKQILVHLKQGTIADAKLEAAKGEQTHSEGHTNKDKRNQVRMVLTDPEVLERLEALLGHPGAFPSDRAIADYCRVTAPTVASVVAALVEEGLLELPEERVGKDGRIQKTRKQSGGGEGDRAGDAAPDRSERKRFVRLYKEFGGARALAIEILPDLSAADLRALVEAIQEQLEDDAE